MKMREQLAKSIWLIAVIAGVSLVFFSHCGKDGASQEASRRHDAKTKAKLILKVNDSMYTNGDFDAYVRGTAGAQELSDVSLSRLFDKFVEEKLLLEAARRQGLILTEEEKKNYLAKLASESQPDELMTSSETVLDQHLFDRPLIEKYSSALLKDIQAQTQEIDSYYEEHKKEFLVPERVKVSQILLETENKAVGVIGRLANANEEEFRKIAQEESIGPEASRGGDMGVFKIGDLPYEMEKVIFSLEEGKLSPVVESSYGYHIFRVDRRYPPQLLSKEEAGSTIRLIILDRKVKDALSAHLEELKRSLPWKSYPEMLFFAYQRNDQ